MAAMETAVQERLGYLQRHKVGLTDAQDIFTYYQKKFDKSCMLNSLVLCYFDEE